MREAKNQDMFTVRRRIRKWKSFSGVFHLITVCSLVFSLLWILPQLGSKSAVQVGQEVRDQLERRQLLLEALDKMVRYQKYYNEVHGRYTRDLSRLTLPAEFTSGRQEDLQRAYEISVLEVRPNRFQLLATGLGSSDRITIDESHRINSNFVLPAPARAYLIEEADRLLRLKAQGLAPNEGLVVRYWKLGAEEGQELVAVGLRSPVLGERREISAGNVVSIFDSIREKVQSRLNQGRFPPPRELASVDIPKPNAYKEELEPRDAAEWLEAAHLAQHVHQKEKGKYASRWEELDAVSNYKFTDRMRVVKNLRVHPIDLTEGGYQLTLEGTAGDMMGEQYLMDKSGSLRQVRYTETLIEQLQKTTNILENFQINPIVDDPTQRHRP